MIHDPELIEKIQKLPKIQFDGDVFRATGIKADPAAFSTSGGRWSISGDSDGGFSILYTSLERNGALAEVASYLSLLSPVPQKSLKVHRITVSVNQTLKLAASNFSDLGIDPEAYGQRSYERTQLIGAAINFLELDGLIAPSARWSCDNLMIFENNHSLESKLEVIEDEEVLYQEWKQYSDNREGSVN